jgi:hypothetical protein
MGSGTINPDLHTRPRTPAYIHRAFAVSAKTVVVVTRIDRWIGRTLARHNDTH